MHIEEVNNENADSLPLSSRTEENVDTDVRLSQNVRASSEASVIGMLAAVDNDDNGSSTEVRDRPSPLSFGSILPESSASNAPFNREQRRKEKSRAVSPTSHLSAFMPSTPQAQLPDSDSFWTNLTFVDALHFIEQGNKDVRLAKIIANTLSDSILASRRLQTNANEPASNASLLYRLPDDEEFWNEMPFSDAQRYIDNGEPDSRLYEVIACTMAQASQAQRIWNARSIEELRETDEHLASFLDRANFPERPTETYTARGMRIGSPNPPIRRSQPTPALRTASAAPDNDGYNSSLSDEDDSRWINNLSSSFVPSQRKTNGEEPASAPTPTPSAAAPNRPSASQIRFENSTTPSVNYRQPMSNPNDPHRGRAANPSSAPLRSNFMLSNAGTRPASAYPRSVQFNPTLDNTSFNGSASSRSNTRRPYSGSRNGTTPFNGPSFFENPSATDGLLMDDPDFGEQPNYVNTHGINDPELRERLSYNHSIGTYGVNPREFVAEDNNGILSRISLEEQNRVRHSDNMQDRYGAFLHRQLGQSITREHLPKLNIDSSVESIPTCLIVID